jgi:hypothetical protein
MFGLESLNKKSMNNLTDDYYKKKYLKYKQKYIELKQHGGFETVAELTAAIEPLNKQIQDIGNKNPPKFRTYIVRKHEVPDSCDEKCIYEKLVENGLLIVDGKSYDIFDPKQRTTHVDYDKFIDLLNNMYVYKITPETISSITYTNLGQLFRDILRLKDDLGKSQNLRFEKYEDVVKKILNSVKPGLTKKSDSGFNPGKVKK